MNQNMMDNLINKIKEKNSPIVMGIDPRYEMIPDIIKSKYPKDMAGFAESAVVFAKKLIDATYDIIPAIKPQSKIAIMKPHYFGKITVKI